jgi:hypothetical protein
MAKMPPTKKCHPFNPKSIFPKEKSIQSSEISYPKYSPITHLNNFHKDFPGPFPARELCPLFNLPLPIPHFIAFKFSGKVFRERRPPFLSNALYSVSNGQKWMREDGIEIGSREHYCHFST